MNLQLQPITISEAQEFVRQHHRHHPPPESGLFAAAANDGTKVVAVVIVGRPTPKAYQDGWTAEVTRLCTDGSKNAASMLYAASWRACRALGYRRMGTYLLAREPGTSVKAAKWVALYSTKDRPKGWGTPSRPRVVKAPTEAKTFWAPDEVWERYPVRASAAVLL